MTTDPESLGELSRNLRRFEQSVQQSLDKISTNFVLNSVWVVEKKSLEDKIVGQGREIAQLRAAIQTRDTEKEHEHKELHGRIDQLREGNHQRDDTIRKEKAARWFAIGLAALGLVFGIISAVVAASLNTAINGGP